MKADRPTLDNLQHLSCPVRNALSRIMYDHEPTNGTFLILPFDQLVEHGPAHEFKWDGSAKPESVIELVNRGPFSGLVLSLGQAQKYHPDVEVPLIVKLDGHFYTGKTNDVNYPIPTNFGSVDEVAEIGAAAVGLTFYLGSIDTGRDVERIGKIRQAAHEAGLPLVLWVYPRGPVPNEIQINSLLWAHYAVSAGESIGADIVKTKFPDVVSPDKRDAYEDYINGEYGGKISEASRYLDYEPHKEELLEYKASLKKGEKPDYNSLLSEQQHVERVRIVTNSGTRTFVIYSGGPRISGDAKTSLRQTTEIIMKAGGEGRIIGRNLWGVPIEEGLELAETVSSVMNQEEFSRPRGGF